MTAFKPPRGTRDFTPVDMARRNYVLSTIRDVFLTYGYREIETPAFEDLGVLTAKNVASDEIAGQIFKFNDYGGRLMGLRFDLTVPMCRFVSNNPQLPKPFKRSQIGRVWRYERPRAGRFREFWQADVDNIGTTTPESDVEPVAAAISSLEQLGFKDFKVVVNSRKLLEEIIKQAGVSENKVLAAFRCIDKIGKLSEAEVVQELDDYGIKMGNSILKKLSAKGKPSEVAKIAATLVKDKKGLNELKEFLRFAKPFGIEKYIEVDLSLARGMAYYTGMIFEVKVKGMEKYGSIVGGGRYDELIGLYGERGEPATGLSLGVERILEVMTEKKMFPDLSDMAKVFVVPIGDSTREYAVEFAQKLRSEGIKVDLDLMRRSISKNLDYANSVGFSYVVLIGEDEIKAKKVTLRDMKTGKQESLSFGEVLKRFKQNE